MGKYYDRNVIYDRITSEELCRALGLEIKDKAGKLLVINPCREDDTEFGSCILNKKGIYDYADEREYNYESIVMSVLGVSYTDALEWLANQAGISEENWESADIPPLTDDELKSLGLKSGQAFDLKGMSDHRTDALQVRNNEGLYLLGKNIRFSFRDLWKEDKVLYYQIVAGKVNEQCMIAAENIHFLGTLEGAEYLYKNFGDFNERENLIQIYRERTEYFQRLLEKVYDAANKRPLKRNAA